MTLEIQLINCKVKSKLKWTKHCVLSAADSKNNINEDASANDMIFTIKGTELYIPVVTFLSKRQSKILKTSYQRI